MKHLKRILTGLAVAAGLFFGETRASAQFAVTDLPLLAQEIIAWTDEIIAAGDQLSKLTDSVNKYQEMIDKTKAIYNKIDPYIQSGKTLYEVYRETDRIAYDFKMLEQYITNVGQGKLTPSKIRALRMQATLLAKELEYIVQDVQKILDPFTNFSTKDREEATEKKKEDLEKISETVEETMHTDALGMINAELERSIQSSTMAAIGMISSPEQEKKRDEMLKKVYKKVGNTAGVDGSNETELYKTDSTTTVDKVFDFVTAVIGVMAVLMLVWAYGSRAKGEPRHQDALWKVFAGLIFILLLLQVLKVTIFGLHGFDMILPNF